MEIVAQGKLLPTLKELFQMIITFGLTVFAWIFFRAEDITHAISYISGIFSKSLFSLPISNDVFKWSINPYSLFGLIFMFFLIEWLGRENRYAIAKLELKVNKTIRYLFYYTIIILIFWFGGKEQEFIYFQF